MRLHGAFPVKPRLEYELSEKSRQGSVLNFEANSYSVADGNSSSGYLRTNQFKGIVFYKYNIFKDWNISASGNFSPKEQYELYDEKSSNAWFLLSIPLGNKPAPVQV